MEALLRVSDKHLFPTKPNKLIPLVVLVAEGVNSQEGSSRQLSCLIASFTSGDKRFALKSKSRRERRTNV